MKRPLRTLVITESDPLYVIRFFEVFFEVLPKDRIELLGVTVSKAFHEPIHRTARRILRFYGPVDFTRLLCRWGAAKVAGRSIESLASRHGHRLIPAESVNAESYLEQVRALEPDVIVSVAAPEIFKAPLLGIPRLGCVNIHSGRLPAYRGMMPTFWQMLQGESDVTVTIHRMVERLDAGAILAEERFPLRSSDRLDRVITGTKRLGGRLMIDTLLDLEARLEAGRLPEGEPGYFRFPAPGDVRRFRAKGHRML
jgi:methionyl-tRNA formyltransferase